jgi:hypothetical protein
MPKIFSPVLNKRIKVKRLKIVYHTIPDEHGVDQKVKYVEYTVIGKYKRWKDCMLYEDFKKYNKDVQIKT